MWRTPISNLIKRLRVLAETRRQIFFVQMRRKDRTADLLEEAANELEKQLPISKEDFDNDKYA